MSQPIHYIKAYLNFNIEGNLALHKTNIPNEGLEHNDVILHERVIARKSSPIIVIH